MRNLLSTLLICLVLMGCRNTFEKPSWNIDGVAPILRSKVTLAQLVPPDVLDVDSTGILQLTYAQDLYKLQVDSLFKLPTEPAIEDYSPPFGPLNYAPGQVLTADTQNTVLGIGGVELKELVFRSGYFELEIQNQIEEALILDYVLPQTTKNGNPFSIQLTIPAGTNAQPSSTKVSYNMADYAMNLTGQFNNSFNRSEVFFQLMVDPNGSIVSIDDTDTLKIISRFVDATPQIARGFFNQQQVLLEKAYSEVDVFGMLKSGGMSLKEAEVRLKIENEIGMDLRAQNVLLTGDQLLDQGGEIELEKPFSSINVARSVYLPNTTKGFKPTLVEVVMDETNSNLTEFLAAAPERLGYALELEINPLGNISGNNDFVYYNTGLSMSFEIDVPLITTFNELVIEDTIDYKFVPDPFYDNMQEGFINLLVKNHFPFDLQPTLLLYNDNHVFLDSLTTNEVWVAPYIEGDDYTVIPLPIDQNKLQSLYSGTKVLLRNTLNTNGTDTMALVQGMSDHIELVLVADVNYQIQFEENE